MYMKDVFGWDMVTKPRAWGGGGRKEGGGGRGGRNSAGNKMWEDMDLLHMANIY